MELYSLAPSVPLEWKRGLLLWQPITQATPFKSVCLSVGHQNIISREAFIDRSRQKRDPRTPDDLDDLGCK